MFSVLFFLFTFTSFAQVDREFWFAVPYVNVHHGLEDPDNFGGSKPLYFKISTLGEPAHIVIEQPARNNLVLFDTTIGANQTVTYEIPQAQKDNIVVSKQGNLVEDKGIHIFSDEYITVYYENATVQNPDLFALKGENALGSLFYTPFQSKWPNDPKHNANHDDPVKQYQYVNREGYIYRAPDWDNPVDSLTPDSAFSAFDIVATENNTVIEITPTTDIVGHRANSPFEITLNKGQTYSARALRQGVESITTVDGIQSWRCPVPQNSDITDYDPWCRAWQVSSNKATDNLSGSKIEVKSGGKVAVTIKDDSVFENDKDNSFSGGCEDFLGDQLVPVEMVGTEYIVMRGQLIYENVEETFFFVATEDNTVVTIDGVSFTLTTAGDYEMFELCGGDGCSSVDDFTYITSTKPIYVLQTTGYNCELAAAVLPPINICTGSYQVGFTRTYGGAGDPVLYDSDNAGNPDRNRRFYMNLMVRNNPGAQEAFTVYTNGAVDADATNNIRNNATFVQIGGNNEWLAAIIPFNNDQMTNGAHLIKNSESLFHMAFINSTSNKFTESDGYVLTGSEYGYFSNYNEAIPDAFIVKDGKERDSAYYDIVLQEDIQLFAEGGISYLWHTYQKRNSEGVWEDLDLDAELVDSDVTDYKPALKAPLDTGVYRIMVDIRNDCFPGFVDTLYAFILIGPDSNTDTVCTTVPNDCISGEYMLDTLNQFGDIIGENNSTYIEGWYTRLNNPPTIFQNYEGNNMFVGNPTLFNATGTNIVQSAEDFESVNFSDNIYLLEKTSSTGGNSSIQKTASATYQMQTPINLANGNVFRYTYKYNGAPITLGTDDRVRVYMKLLNNGETVDSIAKNIPPSDLDIPEWKLGEFFFTDSVETVTHIQIGFITDASEIHGFYFDDIQLFDPGVFVEITNPNNYIFTECFNIVYAKVVNNDPQSGYEQYQPQYVWVREEGRAHHDLVTEMHCISEEEDICVVLQNYDQPIHDNVIGVRDWFADAAMTIPVDKSVPICVSDSTVFYCMVQDNCENLATLTLDVVPLPVTNALVQDTVCASQALGGTQVVVNLRDYESEFIVNSSYTWEYTWYSDEARTSRISNPENVTVANDDIFYLSINKPNRYDCDVDVVLELYLELEPDGQFDIPNMCLDAGVTPVDLGVSAGCELTGSGISGTSFNPLVAGVGVHNITYSCESQACSWTWTDQVEVFDIPVLSVEDPSRDSVLYNTDTIIDLIVTGGTPVFEYLWTPIESIQGANNIEDITTILITGIHNYNVVVTDANGCRDILDISVHPWSTELFAYITHEPICEGGTATIVAHAFGGSGNYRYVWSTGDDSGTTTSTEDTIYVSPSVNTVYSVTVTDVWSGIETTQTITQIVNQNPTINFPTLTPSICADATGTMEPNVSGGTTPYTHIWTGETSVINPTNIENPNIITTSTPDTYDLNYVVVDANGCSDTSDVSLTLNANPVISGDFNYEVCELQSVTLDVDVDIANGFVWTGSRTDLLSGIAIQQPVFTAPASSAGLYPFQFTATNTATSCSSTVAISVVVNAVPVINVAGQENGVCYGESIALTASPMNLTYNWIDGNVTTSGNPFVYAGGTVGTHTVDVIGLNSTTTCADTIPVQIVVHELPTIVSLASATSGCVGDALQLQADITGGRPNYIYSWQPSANVVPSNTQNPFFTSATSGNFDVILTVTDNSGNPGACSNQGNVTLVINDNPNVYFNDTALCSRYEEFVPVTDIGNTVEWSGSTAIISDSSSVAQVGILAPAGGTYIIGYHIVNPNTGCDTDGSSIVTIFDTPDLELAETPFCADREGVLTSEIVNNIVSILEWPTLEGLTVLPDRTSALVLGSVGSQELVVTARSLLHSECFENDTITLEIFPNPQADIRANGVNSEGIAPFGSTQTLEAVITSWTAEPYIYTWSDDLNKLATTSGEQVELVYIDANSNNVSLLVEDANTCTATVILPVRANDTILSASLEICEKDSSNTDIGIHDTELRWGNSFTYRWETTDGQVVGSQRILTGNFNRDSMFILYVSNGFVELRREVPVTVHKDPSINLVARANFNDNTEEYYTSDSIYVSSNLILAEDAYVDYNIWMFNAFVDFTMNDTIPDVVDSVGYIYTTQMEDTVKFTYYVEDNFGCFAYDSLLLPILESAEPHFDPPVICVGDTTTLVISNYNEGTVQWNFNNVEYEVVETSPRGDTAKIIFKTGGQTDFDVTFSVPTVFSKDSITVSYYPNLTIVGPENVCEGAEELYFASEDLNRGADLDYIWYVNGDTHTAEESFVNRVTGPVVRDVDHEDVLTVDIQKYRYQNTDSVEVISMDDSAFVQWVVEDIDTVHLRVDNNGCILNEAKVVTVHPNPVPEFIYYNAETGNLNDIYRGTEVKFENLSDSTNRYYSYEHFTYYWDYIGDDVYTGETYDASEDLFYIYQEMGVFPATLYIVNDETGCKAETIKEVNVVPNPNCDMLFVNTFTPLLDDHNTFYPMNIVGVQERDFTFRIFSRSGALIWETHYLHDEWDGTYNNRIAKQEVYVYQVDALCENGETKEFRGDVYLSK